MTSLESVYLGVGSTAAALPLSLTVAVLYGWRYPQLDLPGKLKQCIGHVALNVLLMAIANALRLLPVSELSCRVIATTTQISTCAIQLWLTVGYASLCKAPTTKHRRALCRLYGSFAVMIVFYFGASLLSMLTVSRDYATVVNATEVFAVCAPIKFELDLVNGTALVSACVLAIAVCSIVIVAAYKVYRYDKSAISPVVYADIETPLHNYKLTTATPTTMHNSIVKLEQHFATFGWTRKRQFWILLGATVLFYITYAMLLLASVFRPLEANHDRIKESMKCFNTPTDSTLFGWLFVVCITFLAFYLFMCYLPFYQFKKLFCCLLCCCLRKKKKVQPPSGALLAPTLEDISRERSLLNRYAIAHNAYYNRHSPANSQVSGKANARANGRARPPTPPPRPEAVSHTPEPDYTSVNEPTYVNDRSISVATVSPSYVRVLHDTRTSSSSTSTTNSKSGRVIDFTVAGPSSSSTDSSDRVNKMAERYFSRHRPEETKHEYRCPPPSPQKSRQEAARHKTPRAAEHRQREPPTHIKAEPIACCSRELDALHHTRLFFNHDNVNKHSIAAARAARYDFLAGPAVPRNWPGSVSKARSEIVSFKPSNEPAKHSRQRAYAKKPPLQLKPHFTYETKEIDISPIDSSSMYSSTPHLVLPPPGQRPSGIIKSSNGHSDSPRRNVRLAFADQLPTMKSSISIPAAMHPRPPIEDDVRSDVMSTVSQPGNLHRYFANRCAHHGHEQRRSDRRKKRAKRASSNASSAVSILGANSPTTPRDYRLTHYKHRVVDY